MTQEDKELLIKDLCARLPYGPVIRTWYDKIINIKCVGISAYSNVVELDIPEDDSARVYIDNVKPYLFPLSSMTEEQKKYISDRWGVNEDFDFEIDPNWGRFFVDLGDAVGFINWCYENHFDINFLILKGLALDATGKGIY